MNKAYGPDGMSPKFIKMGGNCLVKPLTKLFNLSLSIGKFPSIWKQANVLPLYKKGDKHLRNNYRPVSLLCILGKILERVVYKHVFNHFRDNFLISIYQSGFLPNSSTVTQLTELYHKFCEAVSNGKEIRIVFLDISKAFDRVWHKGLIFKLQKWGISGKLLEWFKSYLKDRIQRVCLNGQFSSWANIDAGVPQGSVLGPLLFLVFINDITHIIKHCKIRLFADDTCLYIEVDNHINSADLINEDLKSIENWSKAWLVSFSAPKTESMVIGYKPNQNAHPDIFLHDIPIVRVTKHKHVGLWLESNLWWHYHIDEISTKASKRLNILNYFKYKLNRSRLESIYLTFIRPVMEYSSVVWAGAHQRDLDILDKIQIRAMQIVTGCTRGTSHKLLYKETGWLSLNERRNVATLKLFYQCVNNNVPSYLSNILPMQRKNIGRYNLRNANDYAEPKCRLLCHVRSFLPRAIKLWNALGEEIRNKSSLTSFSIAINPHNYLFRKHSRWRKFISSLGSRKYAVVQARLRTGCSKLNHDLAVNLKVQNSKACSCGSPSETVFHYFFVCPNYVESRIVLFSTIFYWKKT